MKASNNPHQAWWGLITWSFAILLVSASAVEAARPAIEAALALPRTEPRHYVQTSLTLVELGAREQAGTIAAELSALEMTDEQRVALVDEVGSAKLIRLGRELPDIASFVQQTLAVADAAAKSPERLAKLVEQLGGERTAAIEAIRALRRTGEAGVEYCLDQLAETNDEKQRAHLREALVALDPISLPGLFMATGSEQETVRTQAYYALGRLGELNRLRTPIAAALVTGEATKPGAAGDAARWAYQKIAGGQLSIPQAKAQLDAAIDELLASPPLFGDAVEVPNDYPIRLAARLAKQRFDLDPTSQQAERKAAILAWQTGASPTSDYPTTFLNETLHEALQLEQYTAAATACQQLGTAGDLAALVTAGTTRSPLATALEAPHPAVRFAAVEAITKINPQSPFAGSSRVADALIHFASATGDQEAVVAYPQLAKAGQTAGWLLADGYTATPVNRGSDAVRLATESPDIQLVLLDMSTSLPDVRETLFRLRRSPATALVPVAVLAPDGRLSEAQRIAEEHGDKVMAYSRPHSLEATSSMAARLAEQLPSSWPTSEQRLAHAQAAREFIAKLLDDGPGFYGFDRHRDEIMAVLGQASGEVSLEALVELGTPASQFRLMEAASLEVRSLEARQAASKAFAESVQQHGVLLTTDQIRLQYDRYNASETAPQTTQQLLGGILDTLEAARK